MLVLSSAMPLYRHIDTCERMRGVFENNYNIIIIRSSHYNFLFIIMFIIIIFQIL